MHILHMSIYILGFDRPLWERGGFVCVEVVPGRSSPHVHMLNFERSLRGCLCMCASNISKSAFVRHSLGSYYAGTTEYVLEAQPKELQRLLCPECWQDARQHAGTSLPARGANQGLALLIDCQVRWALIDNGCMRMKILSCRYPCAKKLCIRRQGPAPQTRARP